MTRFLITSAFLICFATIAKAQMDGNPEYWCRGGFYTSESPDFRLAKVKKLPNKGVKRSFFRNDDRAECPGGRGCETKTYVVPGDEVIVNRTFGGFACSWFSPAKGGGTVGWLSVADLEFVDPAKDVPLENWLGEWTSAENSINFTHNKLAGWLNVSGNAFWKGLGDNIHIGELDGRVEPTNGKVDYSDGDDEYDCKATMRLLGGYLIVSDNMKCGGMNVSFSGVYRRAEAEKR